MIGVGFFGGIVVAAMLSVPLVLFLHLEGAAAFLLGVVLGIVCTTVGMALDS